jgi:hypothetical protein
MSQIEPWPVLAFCQKMSPVTVGGVPELANGLTKLMVRVLALPRIVVGSLG